MGGKGGGGGGDYYQMPPDTSGYGTLEEATASLAKEAPLDMSKYQQTIDVQKAAANATAPEPPAVVSASNAPTETGTKLAAAMLEPPEYWKDGTLKAKNAAGSGALETTQT